ncbi:MAG: cell division protein ZipA C-terminal FtsZ-binding domain-containing protein [Halothiobacillaceae bacterium]
MEYLRWILLGVGVVVLIGIFLVYSRRKEESELRLDENAVGDPLDAHIEHVDRAGGRSEPRLDEDLPGGGEWSEDLDEAERGQRRKVIETPEMDFLQGYPADLKGPVAAQADQPLRGDVPPAAAPEPAVESGGEPQTAAPERTERAGDAMPEVITLYLVSRNPEGFDGAQVRAALVEHGLEFGDMQIYHYPDATGISQFSVMNAVAPGVFDPASDESHATRGLAMFMQLPIPGQPALVIENMLAVANRIAEALDADLLDDQRAPLSTESIDRWREMTEG